MLNFGLAKEQHAALHPEKAESLKFVIVGDDVSVGRTQGSIVGRRFVTRISAIACSFQSIGLNAAQRSCRYCPGI